MMLSSIRFLRRNAVLALCVLLLSSCGVGGFLGDSQEPVERQPVTRKPDAAGQTSGNAAQRDTLTPMLNSINNRITTYEQKSEEWKEAERKASFAPAAQEKMGRINECQMQLQEILTDYTNLRTRLMRENRANFTPSMVGDSLLQLNQQDIDFLEGGCSKLLAEVKKAPQQQQDVGPSTDPQIKAAFDSGDYDRVITLYGQPAFTPGQIPAHETTLQYGQALIKNHQEGAARKVLSDLLTRVRLQQGQDALTFQLMQLLADLDLSTGSYNEARKQYEELVRLSIERSANKEEWAGLQLAALEPGAARPEELKEYSSLLNKYLAYTPKRDGYSVAEQAEKFSLAFPGSRLLSSVNVIQKTSREQADAWLSQGIKRIEAQAGDRKIPEPQAPVGAAAPGSPASPSFPSAVAPGTEKNTTDLSPPPVPQGPTYDEKMLQDDYSKGMKHFESKEYDKAIESFNKLSRTPYEEKVRSKIEEASRLGAQEDRQKAADLFVRATNTRDQENKKKLLLSSRQLLQGILVKYPQSGLNDKVQKNLSRIDEELKTIDAGQRSSTTSKGAAYVPPGSPR